MACSWHSSSSQPETCNSRRWNTRNNRTTHTSHGRNSRAATGKLTYLILNYKKLISLVTYVPRQPALRLKSDSQLFQTNNNANQCHNDATRFWLLKPQMMSFSHWSILSHVTPQWKLKLNENSVTLELLLYPCDRQDQEFLLINSVQNALYTPFWIHHLSFSGCLRMMNPWTGKDWTCEVLWWYMHHIKKLCC